MRKSKNIFIIFEEAIAIKSNIWEAAQGMLVGNKASWICILAPTDTSTKKEEE